MKRHPGQFHLVQVVLSVETVSFIVPRNGWEESPLFIDPNGVRVAANFPGDLACREAMVWHIPYVSMFLGRLSGLKVLPSQGRWLATPDSMSLRGRREPAVAISACDDSNLVFGGKFSIR